MYLNIESKHNRTYSNEYLNISYYSDCTSPILSYILVRVSLFTLNFFMCPKIYRKEFLYRNTVFSTVVHVKNSPYFAIHTDIVPF